MRIGEVPVSAFRASIFANTPNNPAYRAQCWLSFFFALHWILHRKFPFAIRWWKREEYYMPGTGIFAALLALIMAAAPAAWSQAGDFQAWAHAADFRIDTRPQGADVAGDVLEFPLLIRLDSSAFPFAEAKPDGTDLRVSAPDGAALPFEIERWDPVSRRAEVWVRVPLIKGNSDAGFVRLHWGNPQAASASNGKAVFDSAQGWAGVWHLRDAALNDAVGVSASADGSLSQAGEGMIAGGRQLSGNSGGLAIANGSALNPARTSTNWRSRTKGPNRP